MSATVEVSEHFFVVGCPPRLHLFHGKTATILSLGLKVGGATEIPGARPSLLGLRFLIIVLGVSVVHKVFKHRISKSSFRSVVDGNLEVFLANHGSGQLLFDIL